MQRATVRRFASLSVVVVLALLALAAGAAPAGAHAALLSTAPGDGQVLAATPRQVSLRFSEPAALGLAGIRLIGPDGDTLPTGPPAHPRGAAEVVSVAVPDVLSDGTYTVAWHVVSVDSHPVRGAFTFSVGAPTPTSAAAGDAGPSGGGAVLVLYAAARGVSFAGFALLVGTAYLAAACWPGALRRRGVRRLAWAGWSALLAATVLTGLLYGPYATGGSAAAAADPALLGATLGVRMGVLLALRTVLLALAGAALVLAGRRQDTGAALPGAPEGARRARRGAAVLACGCVLALTFSLAGHSAAGARAVPAVVADTVHLVAMAVWAGGLAVLGAVLLRGGDTPAPGPALTRFSRAAAACVGLLLVTGVFQAVRQVPEASALWGTAYGRVLAGKVGLVVVLVALGAASRRWVRRHYRAAPAPAPRKRRGARPGDGQVRRMRRLVVVETAVAAAVLGLTAVLVNTDPARAAQSAAGPARGGLAAGPVSRVAPFDAGGAAGRGLVAATVLPARVGPNEVHLALLDTAGRPKKVPEVRAAFTLPERSLGPLAARLTPAGPGHYVATAASLPLPGRWQLSLAVRTSDVDEAVVRIPVDVR